MTKTSTTSLQQTIDALSRISPAQLRDKYQEVFGEPTRSGNRDFLFKRLAWRIQSLAEGTLSERARRRAEELARDADLRTTAPRPTQATVGAHARAVTGTVRATAHDRLPIPGTVLTRTYRGRRVEAKVLPRGGFEHDGQVYRSLSAVAKAVTGSHWNGHLFFGLVGKKENAK
jgi:hypothetical protein